jgi:hypothetical protein
MAPYEGAVPRYSVLTTLLHLKGQELLSFSNLAFENAHVRPYRCSKMQLIISFMLLFRRQDYSQKDISEFWVRN